MQFVFNRQTFVVAAARGKTDASRAYYFSVIEDDGSFTAGSPAFTLTTGLDVTFLMVRPFTDTSVLVLYHTGDPVTPQFAVAEFDVDDEHINHVLDHASDIASASGDWKSRRPGDTTATPPDIEAADKAKAVDAKLAKEQGLK